MVKIFVSGKYAVSASNDVELDSSSGVVKSLARHEFNHADNSLLADLISVKSTLSAGDVLAFDGSNVIKKSDVVSNADLATYAQSADVASTYETIANVSAIDSRLATVESSYLVSADLASYAQSADVASTYETIANVSAIDGRLATVESAASSYLVMADLASYAQSADVASTYETIANVSAIGSRVSTLEGAGYLVASDISGKADQADLAALETRVGTIEGHEASYLTSADIAGFADATDLTALDGRVTTLESNASSYLTSSSIEGKAEKMNPQFEGTITQNSSVGTAAAKYERYVFECDATDVASYTAFTGAIANNEAVSYKLSCLVYGSVNSGVIEMSGMFKKVGSANAELIAGSDLQSFSGGLTGDELTVSLASNSFSINTVGTAGSGTTKNVLAIDVLRRLIA
jgi:hypothetical protein